MGSVAWKSYFWPNTDVLANLLNLYDPYTLRAAEYRITMAKTEEILNGQVELPETATVEELAAIHRHLFSDIYPFAGQARTVGISTEEHDFPDPARFESYTAEFDADVGSIDWTTIGREQFVEEAAKALAKLNELHCFREGNGRANHLFITRLGERGGFVVDFSLIAKHVLDRAAYEARPRGVGSTPDHRPLLPMLDAIVIDVDDLDQDGQLTDFGGVVAATTSKPQPPQVGRAAVEHAQIGPYDTETRTLPRSGIDL